MNPAMTQPTLTPTIPVWGAAVLGAALALALTAGVGPVRDKIAEPPVNGSAPVQAKPLEEAATHFEEILEMMPAWAEGQQHLGLVFFQQGKLEEAVARFRRAVEIEPRLATAHDNLGNILMQTGKLDEAATHFLKALEIDPGLPRTHGKLGIALYHLGRWAEAIPHFEQALKISPDDGEAHNNFGAALQQAGRRKEALQHFQMAADLRPDDAGPLNNQAWLLATCPEDTLRDGKRALLLARRANLLAGGNNAAILNSLAAACAGNGLFAEALENADRALELASAQGNTALADIIRKARECYRNQLPYRDPEVSDTPSPPRGP